VGIVREGLLARWLPFFRRNQSVRVADVAGSASLAAVGTVSASARAWHPAAPVDERIEALRTYVTEVEGRLNQLDHRFSLEIWDRKQAVGDLDRKLNQEVSELHLLLASKEQQTARIDSRGLPVIAAGIFLSGVPEALASALPWGLSWLFPVVGVWSALAAAVPAWREAH